jgi:hypothetical protein
MMEFRGDSVNVVVTRRPGTFIRAYENRAATREDGGVSAR